MTVLFELNDQTHDFQDLIILESPIHFTGLPVLSHPLQKDFVTRWMNDLVSPSTIDPKALSLYESDGLASIPEIVTRANNLWEEYNRHVFGQKLDTIFSKIPK